MDENTFLREMEELAQSLGIEVRYENFKKEGGLATGGLCRLKGQYLLIIHTKAPVKDKIQALAVAVSRFDLSRLYLKPGLRDYLDLIQPRTP